MSSEIHICPVCGGKSIDIASYNKIMDIIRSLGGATRNLCNPGGREFTFKNTGTKRLQISDNCQQCDLKRFEKFAKGEPIFPPPPEKKQIKQQAYADQIALCRKNLDSILNTTDPMQRVMKISQAMVNLNVLHIIAAAPSDNVKIKDDQFIKINNATDCSVSWEKKDGVICITVEPNG